MLVDHRHSGFGIIDGELVYRHIGCGSIGGILVLVVKVVYWC